MCFVKFPLRTYDYLREATLDDWTFNKTIQKIVESRRVMRRLEDPHPAAPTPLSVAFGPGPAVRCVRRLRLGTPRPGKMRAGLFLPLAYPYLCHCISYWKLWKIKGRFDHFNINVADLERSIDFYGRALGLREVKPHGGRRLVRAGLSGRRRVAVPARTDVAARQGGPLRAGRQRAHLCMRVAGDYDAVRAREHRSMGCICYENHDMGLYFINDPDDYWIEILPER